jgi:hypothetical protein
MDKGEGFLGLVSESLLATSEWQRSLLPDRQPHHRACPALHDPRLFQRAS